MRIDPPVPKKGTSAHKHYYDTHGNHLDINGNPVDFGSPESHIPLD